MSEHLDARRFAGYVGIIAVAGFTYYVAQTSIHRTNVSTDADLAIRGYIECLQKVAQIDWSKFDTGREIEGAPATPNPSGSEICSRIN